MTKNSSIKLSRSEAYEALGLDYGASSAEIKRAYRRAVMLHHPDRNVGVPEEMVKLMHERVHLARVAYEKLDGHKNDSSALEYGDHDGLIWTPMCAAWFSAAKHPFSSHFPEQETVKLVETWERAGQQAVASQMAFAQSWMQAAESFWSSGWGTARSSRLSNEDSNPSSNIEFKIAA